MLYRIPTFSHAFSHVALIFSQIAGKTAWEERKNSLTAFSLYYLCTWIRKRFCRLQEQQKS